MIASEVEKYPGLKMLKSYILKGFPRRIPENLVLSLHVKNKLMVGRITFLGIILRRSPVFMSPKFLNLVMDAFHLAYQDISAIKAVACSYVWWPGIDIDLETKVKNV